MSLPLLIVGGAALLVISRKREAAENVGIDPGTIDKAQAILGISDSEIAELIDKGVDIQDIIKKGKRLIDLGKKGLKVISGSGVVATTLPTITSTLPAITFTPTTAAFAPSVPGVFAAESTVLGTTATEIAAVEGITATATGGFGWGAGSATTGWAGLANGISAAAVVLGPLMVFSAIWSIGAGALPLLKTFEERVQDFASEMNLPISVVKERFIRAAQKEKLRTRLIADGLIPTDRENVASLASAMYGPVLDSISSDEYQEAVTYLENIENELLDKWETGQDVVRHLKDQLNNRFGLVFS